MRFTFSKQPSPLRSQRPAQATLFRVRTLAGDALQSPSAAARLRGARCAFQNATVSAARDRDEDKLRRLEAVLFLAREPLGSRKLSEFARLDDGTQARTFIRKLNEQYDRSQRPYRVKQVAEGFQLMTRPKFASWLRRLQERNEASPPLTPPAMETLTVIAYRQPILKAEIEAIRGVGCSDILRQLMERDMVRISGRSSELGRPFLYATTKNFLRTFGLSGLDALPRADQLRGMGLPTWASPSQNQDSQLNDPSRAVDISEESNVTLTSSSLSIEELKAELTLGLVAAPQASALQVSNVDEEEDPEEDDVVDDEEDEEDDEEDEAEEDEDESEWEEIEDDEDWDEEDDEEDEDWDDDEEDDEEEEEDEKEEWE